MRTGYICDAIVRSGHNVTLWIPGFDHFTHKHIYNSNSCLHVNDLFTVKILGSIGYKSDRSILRYIHFLRISFSFYKQALLSKDIPDLILCQIPSVELSFAVARYAKKIKKNYVVDIRDPWPDNYKRLFPAGMIFMYHGLFFLHNLILNYVLKNANAITSVSRTYLKWAESKQNRNPSQKTLVAHIGYDYLYSPRARAKTNIVNFIYAGTIEDNIDINLLLQASSILINNTEVQFHIAGNLYDKKLLKSVLERKNITYHGWLDPLNLSQLLSRCDVGLLIYSKCALQSFPNKPFEYMAHGLILLNSLIGELGEFIDQHKIGYNYNNGSVENFIECIRKIIQNKENAELLKLNSLRLAESMFDSKIIYDKYVKFLEGVS